MAIPLTGILETSEETQTIVYAMNVRDTVFNHETILNTNVNKQDTINEFLYKRALRIPFATCGSASDSTVKSIVAFPGINSETLVSGLFIKVNFTHQNTVNNPQLNINSLGAKNIYAFGSQITGITNGLLSGIVGLLYDGTQWNVVGVDDRVRQTVSDTNAEYPILLKTSNSSSSVIDGTKFTSSITVNPSTGKITSPGFVLSESGSAITTKKIVVGDGTSISPPSTTNTFLKATVSSGTVSFSWGTVDTTDEKVKQTVTSGNIEYPILTKYTNETTTVTDESRFAAGVTLNPSTNTITATNFNGKINNHTVNKDVPSNAVFTDTTYTSGNEITIGTGNAINHNMKLSGGFTPTTTGATISGYGGSGSFKVPVLSVNEYGHVTNASEATVSITLPDNKIINYNAPTYDTAHVSPTYQAVINANAVTTNMVYDTAINKLDYKIAGLTKEVIDDEATLSQATEDEPRYYAKSSTSASASTKVATLVENRMYNLINGTKITVYFGTGNTASDPILVNVNDTGAKILIYNDDIFDGSLIEDGTTLEMVYDNDVSFVTGESPNTITYTDCYRVVGGVGSGSGSGCSGALTAYIEVNNPIGLYAVGDIIETGTCLEEIIKYMLCVVIDVISHLPSLTWSWNPTTTVEVGTTVTPVQNASSTDGYFSSADTTRYPNSTFDTNNNISPSDPGYVSGHLPAGCPLSGTGYGITYPTAVTKTTEGDETFTATLHYGDSTNVPKKSDATNSSVSISEGNATASKNVYWRYKAFYGFYVYRGIEDGTHLYNDITFDSNGYPSNIYKSDDTAGYHTVTCEKGTTKTVISTMVAPAGHPTMVLILPTQHNEITDTWTLDNQNVPNNWVKQCTDGTSTPVTLTRTVNGTSITYNVFVIANNGTGLTYNNIKFR